jgi:hypothetical protein
VWPRAQSAEGKFDGAWTLVSNSNGRSPLSRHVELETNRIKRPTISKPGSTPTRNGEASPRFVCFDTTSCGVD